MRVSRVARFASLLAVVHSLSLVLCRSRVKRGAQLHDPKVCPEGHLSVVAPRSLERGVIKGSCLNEASEGGDRRTR